MEASPAKLFSESPEASRDRHVDRQRPLAKSFESRERPPATRLRVARGSGDRHLDRQRPLATSFESRERLLYSIKRGHSL